MRRRLVGMMVLPLDQYPTLNYVVRMKMFEPIQKQSVSDAVFSQLRTQILAGRLAAGVALPAARTLCRMLGVNRGAVREEIRRLQEARLVSVQHGGATRVLSFLDTSGPDLLAELLVRPTATSRRRSCAACSRCVRCSRRPVSRPGGGCA